MDLKPALPWYIKKLISLPVIGTVPRCMYKMVRGAARLAASFITTGNARKPRVEVEECLICCELKPVAQILAMRNCSHEVCGDCLSRHIEVQVKANKVPVVCPHGCAEHLDLDQCRPHLSAKLVELFELRLVEASIPESQRVYCPFPNCSAFMIRSKDGKECAPESASTAGSWRWRLTGSPPKIAAIPVDVECVECHRIFCMKCRVPWHAGMSCRTYQFLKSEKEEAVLLRLAENKKWQRCRKCGAMVERNHGCNLFLCRCGHDFAIFVEQSGPDTRTTAT